ncbi:MAG: hypothetical protein K0R50_4646 [Eubacterium sp.]|jgi:tetratricopeptide (TPR) repeat protein|nr:hypothetical protein [Eubacterium sp.]
MKISLKELMDKAGQMALANEWGDKAYKINNAILKLDKDNCAAYTRLAKYYKLNNNISEAKVIYLKVLEIDPENRGAINNLNDLDRDEKENDELDNYKTVGDLMKEGQKSMLKGKFRFASKLFLKAFGMDPSISYAVSLAEAYTKMGKADEVMKLYNQILSSTHTETEILNLNKHFSMLGFNEA